MLDDNKSLRDLARETTMKSRTDKAGEANPSPVKEAGFTIPGEFGYTAEQMEKKNRISKELIDTRQAEDEKNVDKQLTVYFEGRVIAFVAGLAAEKAKKKGRKG